jgi:HEPN domain-containing protein
MHNISPQRIEQIDYELIARGIPLILRPLKAFHETSGKSGGQGSIALEAFDEIADWYAQKYGSKALWDGTIGVQPLVIRGMVYFAKIPFIEKSTVLRVTDQIEGITEDVARSLTEDEIKYLCMVCEEAFGDFGALYNLQTFPDLLSQEQWELVGRAGLDLKGAIAVLKDAEDTQNAAFLSQQAAEKYLKAALLSYGLAPQFLKGKIGHNLRKASDELIRRHSKFRYLERAVAAAQLPSMDIRYTEMRCSSPDAVTVFCASRHICGFIAEQWQLDAQRGAPDTEFESGKYYRDYAGRTFRCITVESRGDGSRWARMALLGHDAVLFKVDAVVSLSADFGYFYVPVTDPKAIVDLEARYNSVVAPSLKSEG